jgi:hypothetical protein
MTTLRTAAGLVLISVKPGFIVLGALGLLAILVVAAIGFIAIFSQVPSRRGDAQAVLRTLFGRGQQ